MLLELHAHTSSHSKCSIIDPVTLVRESVRKGLQGLVITDHGYLWSPEELDRLRAQAGVEKHFLLLSAQEVDTDIGHVLVIGADRSLNERIPLKDLRGRYPDAALIWAHPFRNGRDPSEEALLDPCLDALEIFSLNQSPKENYAGLNRWHRYKFTAVSGSDTHAAGKAAVFPTHFDHPVSTIPALAEEIRKGRCRPFFKEILKAGSGMVATEITIGPKGSDELRQRIIIKQFPDKARWGRAKESARITALLHEHGFKDGPCRVPRVVDTNDGERLLIEEGQRGRNLADVVCSVNVETGLGYYRLAARWLAQLHALKLRIGTAEGTKAQERYRFGVYLGAFEDSHSPYLEDARRLVAFVREQEEELFRKEQASFIQLHGDYHPRNIIIGQDRAHDPSTVFVSVIDFDNSLLFDPAFDVGYFCAQFKSQLRGFSGLDRYREEIFIGEYLRNVPQEDPEFEKKVDVFKIRANLSIASYFIKMGMGTSAEMESVISDARAFTKNTLKRE
ncbi:MAG: phosphotransferase [Endomicrobiales bacterium]